MFGKGGQGAIEYLLLLAAAIVVVAIVISFMGNTLGPVTDTGTTDTYEYLCVTVESATNDCKCYRSVIYDSGEISPADCCGDGTADITPKMAAYLDATCTAQGM